jgi:hypothetical protein
MLSLLLSVGAGSAMAQAPAADPAAPTTQTCPRPGHYPGKAASDNKKEAWLSEVRAWGDCVKNYVADLRAQVDAKIKLANSTIEDYNTGVKELQEEQKVAEMQGKVGK